MIDFKPSGAGPADLVVREPYPNSDNQICDLNGGYLQNVLGLPNSTNACKH